MSMEIAVDTASFDVELLQLTEVSPLALKSNPSYVESLFEQWLSLPETNRLVIKNPFSLQNLKLFVFLHCIGFASYWVSKNFWLHFLFIEFDELGFLY